MSLYNKVINMITHARVTLVTSDTEQYPSAQVSYLKKVASIIRLLPYPLVGNPPSSALAVRFALQAQEQNRVGIFHDPKGRLKGLKEGEGGIHNSLTGSYILLLENGDVKIISTNDLIAQITANVTQTVTGNITESCNTKSETATTSHTITSPVINLTGNTTVSAMFGCNGLPAQASASLGNAATDLATVIALANNIRTALIANGIGTT